MKKKGYKLAPVIVILVLLAVWELVVRLAGIPLYVLPAPSDTISAFAEEFPVLLGHAGITVMEALAGMAISFVIGILMGILIDALPTFKRCVYPILVVTQTVPTIVLAPIFIIYLGFGYAPKILTVVLMCFFPHCGQFQRRTGTDGSGLSESGKGLRRQSASGVPAGEDPPPP